MFYFINKHPILQLVLSALLFVWAAFTICTQMTLTPPEGSAFLYANIYAFLSTHSVFTKVLAIVLLLLEVLFIQRFYAVNKFSDNQTMMPIVFFLLCMNAGHFFHTLSPATFTILLMTFIMLFNTQDDNEKPVKNRIFSSGILIGFASLIDFNALWLILFLMFVLFASRFSSFKEIVCLLAGLLLTYIYVFSVFFLTDTLPALGESMRQLTFFGVIQQAKTLSILNWITIGYLVISTGFLVAVLKIYYDNKLIILRKRYITVVLLWFALLIMAFFTNLGLPKGLIYLMTSLTLFYSMLCNTKKRVVVHDIVIVAMLVLLWL